MGGCFVVRWSRSKQGCNFVPKVQQNLKGPAKFGICKGNKNLMLLDKGRRKQKQDTLYQSSSGATGL